jgi:hypothetical protein
MFTYTYVCSVEKYPCEKSSCCFSSSGDACTSVITRVAAVAECDKEECHANMVWCKKGVTCLSQFVLSPPQIKTFQLSQFTHSLYVICVSFVVMKYTRKHVLFQIGKLGIETHEMP